MKKLIVCLSILVMTMFSSYLGAQYAKDYYKSAMEFVEAGKYTDAIGLLTKAIEIDPQMSQAYMKRAFCYEQTNNLEKANEDYGRAIVVDSKNQEAYYGTGVIQYKLMNYDTAVQLFNKAIDLKPRFIEAYQYKILTLIELQRYHEALETSNLTLLLKENAENLYYHGLISKELKNYTGAEDDLQRAISRDKKFVKGYIELAEIRILKKDIPGATESINKALELDPNSVDAHYTRSKIYISQMDYPSAINDITKNILFEPENEKWYFIRGTYYQDFTQHQNAINDFNKVLLLDKMNAEAYYRRAYSYEQIANFSAAIKDYKLLSELFKGDVKAQQMLEEAEKRLFELNRETNKPVLAISNPKALDQNVIELPKNQDKFNLKGLIKDESRINFVKINDKDFPFTMTEQGEEINDTVSLGGKDIFTVTIGDVYNNILSATYTIRRTEIDPPVVKLIAPYASDVNNEVYLESGDANLYVEGKITDDSKISSIIIDGVSASYRPEDMNPGFSATINIANKSTFTVRVLDQYGNETSTVYNLNREGVLLSEENPMGKTWVVFIENSNYETFASLDGPAKDVSLMKAALANYKIQNIIHKKDMTKKDMERFFSIDLRDLIRSNHVNSVVVWYAGHGKFINETGYWIPVDAKRDDEFTYFNISALKASLQSYSSVVTHTLIITDACESGPTFYQAMRGNINGDKNCNDWSATRMKSSQVFSSAGYELAVDNSQFTRTFANSLANNPNSCIPIENIVIKVTDAVVKNNQQKPQFGKIEGLTDENGTFFFVSK